MISLVSMISRDASGSEAKIFGWEILAEKFWLRNSGWGDCLSSQGQTK